MVVYCHGNYLINVLLNSYMVYLLKEQCYKLNFVWFSGSHDNIVGRTNKERTFTLTTMYPVYREERKDDSYVYTTTSNNDVTIDYIRTYFMLLTAIYY